MQFTNFNNVQAVLLKYINPLSITCWYLPIFSDHLFIKCQHNASIINNNSMRYAKSYFSIITSPLSTSFPPPTKFYVLYDNVTYKCKYSVNHGLAYNAQLWCCRIEIDSSDDDGDDDDDTGVIIGAVAGGTLLSILVVLVLFIIMYVLFHNRTHGKWLAHFVTLFWALYKVYLVIHL